MISKWDRSVNCVRDTQTHLLLRLIPRDINDLSKRATLRNSMTVELSCHLLIYLLVSITQLTINAFSRLSIYLGIAKIVYKTRCFANISTDNDTNLLFIKKYQHTSSSSLFHKQMHLNWKWALLSWWYFQFVLSYFQVHISRKCVKSLLLSVCSSNSSLEAYPRQLW